MHRNIKIVGGKIQLAAPLTLHDIREAQRGFLAMFQVKAVLSIAPIGSRRPLLPVRGGDVTLKEPAVITGIDEPYLCFETEKGWTSKLRPEAITDKMPVVFTLELPK